MNFTINFINVYQSLEPVVILRLSHLIFSIKSSCSLKDRPKSSHRKHDLMSVINFDDGPRRKLKFTYRLSNHDSPTDH